MLAGSPAGAARPTPCPDGFFRVVGGPPLIGRNTEDGVFLSHGSVSVMSGCPTQTATVKATKAGTRIHVEWPECLGVPDVKTSWLRAVIDKKTCNTMRGEFKFRSLR